jgi:hypothetical protein
MSFSRSTLLKDSTFNLNKKLTCDDNKARKNTISSIFKLDKYQMNKEEKMDKEFDPLLNETEHSSSVDTKFEWNLPSLQ